MSRHRTYGVMDEAPAADADVAWLGAEMRVHASQLPPGFYAQGINVRCSDGKVKPRKGSVKVGWTNKIAGGGIQPWGTVYGRANFKTAAGGAAALPVDWLITAADGNVYASRSNNGTTVLTLPAGVTVTSRVRFTQAKGILIMWRGLELTPLVMTSIETGFVERPAATGAGKSSMPNGVRGIWRANRLWVQTGDDQVWGSDSLEVYEYSEIGKFKISQGGVDELITIAPFGTDIIALKAESVHRMTSIDGALADVEVREITRRYGCVAGDSVVDVGTDLLWLSDDGVASLTLTELGEIQTAEGVTDKPPMFSDAIDPLIKRIRWEYAENVVAAFWDRRLYVAVPLDDAEVLRPGAIGPGDTYTAGPGYVVQVIAGATYRWSRGANEASLVNGAQTLTASGDFTAAGSTVTINSVPAAVAVTATVQQIYKGVNNVVLVYDFRTQAWAGHDEADGFAVKEFFIARNLKKKRLFSVGADGWVTLHEETFEDQLAEPYVDVEVEVAPSTGETIQVNAGTSVLTGAATGPGTWGVAGGLDRAQQNLWISILPVPGQGGYSPNGTGAWTAPNTRRIKLPTGVRFYGTNGLMPAVAVSNITLALTKVATQAVVTTVVLRGYKTVQKPLARKQAEGVELHVRTWAPSYTVDLLLEGVNEEKALVTDQTRDRTRYTKPHNKAAYDASNVNDDFFAPYREDYSVVFTSSSHQIDLQEGIAFEEHQDFTHRLRVAPGNRGWLPQIRIVNRQGRLELMAAGLEGFEADRRKGSLT